MDKQQDDLVRSTINTVKSEYCIFSSQLGDEEQNFKQEEIQKKIEYPSFNKVIMDDYVEDRQDNNINSLDQDQVENNSRVIKKIEEIEINELKKDNEQNIFDADFKVYDEAIETENKIQSLNRAAGIEIQNIPLLIKHNEDFDSFYEITEKGEIKDYIGSHKVYEIFFYSFSMKEKKIKSYRRYQNFYKFDRKIKKAYPYYIIPRLPPKNPLAKIIPPDSEFFDNRRIQLNNYINFIYKSDLLSKTKEFLKFVNDAEFDEDFFDENNDINYNYYFPESSKVNDTFTNRLYGLLTNIFSANEMDKRHNESEKNLKRMELHYKFLTEKCNNIKENINTFLKSIKKNSEILKKLSGNALYLKDTMERIENSKENFKKFNEISAEISEINSRTQIERGIKIRNEIESYVSILFGLCDCFERYSDYLKIYDNTIKAEKYSISNHLDISFLISEELKQCEIFKKKFEQNLLEEINSFNLNYNNTFINLIEDFKVLVKGMNKEEIEITNKIVK